MNTEQVQAILDAGAFPGKKNGTALVETHISWVILTPDYAFKIKKPLELHFLDFSTLEKRHFYCLEEVNLNRRLKVTLLGYQQHAEPVLAETARRYWDLMMRLV